MTNNRTTELRRMLNERSIEYEINDCDVLLATRWRADGMLAQYLEGVGDDIDLPEDDSLVDLAIAHVTPEQAIAATLGNSRAERTCHNVPDEYWLDDERFECSECGAWMYLESESLRTCSEGHVNYCYNCGARVVPRTENTLESSEGVER